MRTLTLRFRCLIICCATMSGCVPEGNWTPFSGPWPAGATSGWNGTGIVLGEGVVLTAAHVARSCTRITVATESGRFRAVPAELKATDDDQAVLGRDLALLQVDDGEMMKLPSARLVDLWPDDIAMATVPSTSPALTPTAKISLVGYPTGPPSLRLRLRSLCPTSRRKSRLETKVLISGHSSETRLAASVVDRSLMKWVAS